VGQCPPDIRQGKRGAARHIASIFPVEMRVFELGRGAPRKFMQLRDVVEIYKGLAGEFDRPVELELFGLSREETERLFAVFDEDYHISRFIHFTNEAKGASYSINGFPYTHVTIDAAIREIL
jgi:hypothetical protein